MLTIDEQRFLIGEILLLIKTYFNFAERGIAEFFVYFFKDGSLAKERAGFIVVFEIDFDFFVFEGETH